MNINNNTNAVNVKKTQGRRKIAIKPIANQNSRHVTFSKRRLGLFKKASELCILTGAEIAIVVQSMKRQRLFTFGHPSPDTVINRYLTGKGEEESTGDQQFDFVQQSNEYYSQVCRELEAEKKNKEIIDESKMDNNGGGFWWNEAIDDMGIEELENFLCALEELKKKVNMRCDELSMINGSSSLPPSMINGSSSLPPSMINASSSLPPSMINGSSSLPPSMINGSSSLPPSMINASSSLPPSMINASSSLPPSMINASSSLPPSMINGSSSLSPSMINGSSSLPPSTSTMNQTIDYCASIVPFDFNAQF